MYNSYCYSVLESDSPGLYSTANMGNVRMAVGSAVQAGCSTNVKAQNHEPQMPSEYCTI